MNIRKSTAAPEGAERPAMGGLRRPGSPRPTTSRSAPQTSPSRPRSPSTRTRPTCTTRSAAKTRRTLASTEHTGPARPEQPSAAAVCNASRFTLDRLGERWEMLKAAYETGQLGRVVAEASAAHPGDHGARLGVLDDPDRRRRRRGDR